MRGCFFTVLWFVYAIFALGTFGTKETGPVIFALGIGCFLTFIQLKSKSSTPERATEPQNFILTKHDEPGLQLDNHVPPAPHLSPLPAFIAPAGSSGEQIRGVWFHRDKVQQLLKNQSDSTGFYRGRFEALLVRDPYNPHDDNAVAIFIHGLHIGYLSRERATLWASEVDKLANRGFHLQVVSTLSWSGFESGHLDGYIRLPEPYSVFPWNSYPEGESALLPSGVRVQLTKEEEHMDTLMSYLPAQATPLALTVHIIKEIRPRSAINAIEVRLDGERIGILSPTQTPRYWNLIEFLEERGISPVVRGVLSGNTLKANVVLDLPRVEEIPETWLDSFRDRPVNRIFFDMDSEDRPQRPEFMWDDEH